MSTTQENKMAIGPGKYDLYSSAIQVATNAPGVVVIVIGPPEISGFSVTGTVGVTKFLPKLLREIADQLDLDVKDMGDKLV
jgi:hypothetical protein